MIQGLPAYLSGFQRNLRILHGLDPKSISAYTRFVEVFFEWLENNSLSERVEDITRKDLEGYLEWAYYKGNTNATRKTKLGALRRFFTYLVYEGVIKEDLAAMIPRPKIHKKCVQKFCKDEVLKLMSAVDITSEKGIRDICILILAAFCGLRIAEITGITLGDIIDDGRSLDVAVTGKFQKTRVVYLWKAPAECIRRLIIIRITQGAKEMDPLFMSYDRKTRKLSGGRLAAGILGTILRRYADKAKIKKPRLNMHMFRATHASDLRAIKGYDIAAIAERLGHSNISTTDRYLPARGRIHRIYPSLSAYWSEFIYLWRDKANDNSKRK
jgi:site-specific recombinase XerD